MIRPQISLPLHISGKAQGDFNTASNTGVTRPPPPCMVNVFLGKCASITNSGSNLAKNWVLGMLHESNLVEARFEIISFSTILLE